MTAATPSRTPKVLIPVVCDLTNAPDTPAERIDTYRRLFNDALVARDHTIDGIRFRFRADPGIETRVRELASLEGQCCAFFTFTINTVGGEVLLDATVIDDDTARAVLDEFYRLPDTIGADQRTIQDRFAQHGLTFTQGPNTFTPAPTPRTLP